MATEKGIRQNREAEKNLGLTNHDSILDMKKIQGRSASSISSAFSGRKVGTRTIDKKTGVISTVYDDDK